MLYRELGKSGIQASVIACGAWAMGGWWGGGAEEQTSIGALRACLDHGINFIDTAPVYGFGRSEGIVGKAIQGQRDKYVLATKCGLIWDRQAGIFHFYSDENQLTQTPSKYAVYKYLNPDSIRKELEQSLQRLRTDYIDLYQTHWQENTTPIQDTLAVLLQMKKEGKIRAIGVSNATIEQMKEYGLDNLDSDQERFSILDQRFQVNGQLEFCKKNQIAFLAYSPLEQGLLTGKITPNYKFAAGDQRNDRPTFSAENRKRIQALLEPIRPIAEIHHASLTQIVLAWTFHQPGLTHVLAGIRTSQQAAENAFAGQIQLSSAELHTIQNAIQTCRN